MMGETHQEPHGRAARISSDFGMIKEHDRIVLTEPVLAEGLEVGDVGTVVHVYADGKAFEVEFTTLDGKTAAVATVEAAAARSLSAGEDATKHAFILPTVR